MARKEIKMVGKNGQISIGKEFAGQLVMIEETSPNVFTLSLGQFIPLEETWLHKPKNLRKINKALEWASKTPPKVTDIAKLLEDK
jgi:hypothetical protein